MKGVVLLVLRRALMEEGQAAADDVWDRTDLPPTPGKTEDFEDADLHDLIRIAQDRLDGDDEAIARRLGRRAAAELAVEYPSFFTPYDSVIAFLQDLDDEIHPNVLKLFPDAEFPTFEARRSETDDLDILYRSERELCRLAEGLILGTADRYGEQVEIRQPECTHRGDARCRLALTVDPRRE